MGSGYVIDHCIAALNRSRRKDLFENYIADSLWGIMNWMNQGKVKLERYYDLIHPKPKDERTGEEIVADIITRHGLKVVG